MWCFSLQISEMAFQFEIITSYKLLWYLFITEAYSEPSETSKKERFCENIQRLLAVNYFCKTFHLRCLTGFWRRLCVIDKGCFAPSEFSKGGKMGFSSIDRHVAFIKPFYNYNKIWLWSIFNCFQSISKTIQNIVINVST